MTEKLTKIEKLYRGRLWLAILGITVGGLVGTLISISFHSFIFFALNIIILSAFLGGLYPRIFTEDIKVVVIGAILGGICGLVPVAFGILALAGPFIFFCLSDRSKIPWWLIILLSLALLIIGASLGEALGQWINRLYLYNKPAWIWFSRPYFTIPLLSFAGYFIAHKVNETKRPTMKSLWPASTEAEDRKDSTGLNSPQYSKNRVIFSAEKTTVWLPLLAGMLGGLIGLLLLLNVHSSIFVKTNTIIIGSILGALYGWISKEDWRVIAIGGVIGGLCGLHLISLGVLTFGGAYISLSFYALRTRNWARYVLFSLMLWGIMFFFFVALEYIDAGWSSDWYKKVGRVIGLPMAGTLLMMTPFLNGVLACVGGGIIAWQGYRELQYWFSSPLFLLPFLIFAGHFIGWKISEAGKLKEYVQGILKGGLLMTKEKDRKIERVKKKLTQIQKEYPGVTEEVPGMVEYLSGDLTYRGYLGEVGRRFREGQIGKSVGRRTQLVKEAKALLQEIAALGRAEADLFKASYESEATKRQLHVKRKRMDEGEIRKKADLEMDIARLELEVKKTELEESIHQIRARKEAREPKAAGPSPEERFIQSVQYKIKMLKEKSKGAKEIVVARNEVLKGIDREENPDLYKRINNMFNDLLMEVMK